ncbi:MAG: T9SS type A sorting domain-containing protein [Flavobacteriales bacterium]|nr:T9SS type A sorting domain-containing protein [Flavobacteriales bacterium]
MLRSLKGILPLSLVMSMFPLTAQATHVMGSDLGYRHVAGNEYEVTLVVFRHCDGIALASVQNIAVLSTTCSVDTIVSIGSIDQQVQGTGCPGLLTVCQGGNAPGLEIVTYRDTIDLGMACSDWVISWSQCCRQSNISNLSNASQFGATNRCTLDNLNHPGNDSPVFQQFHLPYFCSNELFCLDNGAYDADGDSLGYSMMVPLDENGAMLSYEPGFSITEPFPSANGHQFDPFTGNHCAIPGMLGDYALAYLVEEYRNGVLVGSCMRDLHLITLNCPAAQYAFEGTVSDTLGDPVDQGEVELYVYGLNAAGSVLYGTTPIDAQGQYSFLNVPFGQYILRAVPDSLGQPGLATSYWLNTHFWSFAEVASALCDSTFVCDIMLTGIGDLAGSGYIEGYLGDLGIRSSGLGVAWPGVSVFLEDLSTGQWIAFTRTDQNGIYQFDQVPDGNYRIVLDHPGLPMLSYHAVSLANGSNTWTGIDYAADASGFQAVLSVAAPGRIEERMMKVYPNPAEGSMIMIDGFGNERSSIEVLDAAGRSVLTWHGPSPKGSITLPIGGLPTGTYVARSVRSDRSVRFVVR